MHVAEILTHRTHPTSGVLGAVIELSSALADAGVRVDLWVPRRWPHEDDRGVAELQGRGVRVHVVAASSLVDAARRVASAVNQSGCDVAHLHNGFSPMNNLVAAGLTMPYVVTTHGVYATEGLGHHRRRKSVALRLTERRLLRRAGAITALTPVEREELLVVAPETDPVVLPFGFTESERAVEGETRTDPGTDVRRELRVAAGTPLAVYGGRMDVRGKRLDHLVRGVAGASNWHGLLIGADYEGGRSALEALCAELHVEDRIHLLDYRLGRAYRDVLASADVNVLLSRSEGLPRGIVEGMLEGVPAMVTPEVERRIQVNERGSGWVVQPHGVAAALASVQRIGNDGRARFRTAAAAHGRSYLWPALIPAWIETFDRAGAAR